MKYIIYSLYNYITLYIVHSFFSTVTQYVRNRKDIPTRKNSAITIPKTSLMGTGLTRC